MATINLGKVITDQQKAVLDKQSYDSVNDTLNFACPIKIENKEINQVDDYTNLLYVASGTANEGFSYLKLYYQNKKLHFIIEGNFTTNEDGSLAFGVNSQNLPINIKEKIFRRDGTNLTQNPSTITNGGEIITRIPICLGLTTDFYESTAETANYFATSAYSTILIKEWNALSPNTSYALSLRFELAII